METPCTKVCKLDAAGRICIGCRRTVDEIATWANLTDDERRAIMKALRKRPLPEDAAARAEAPLTIRPAQAGDAQAIWEIIGPVIRAGETYTLPPDMSREAALAYWMSPQHQVFVAELDGVVAGTYYLRANQRGGGAHVANCGYMTAAAASGQGVARRMCEHSLAHARQSGFRAMQFNFVVSTNERAVSLWSKLGFEIVGRLPEAFRHPRLGLVDAFVMYRRLA